MPSPRERIYSIVAELLSRRDAGHIEFDDSSMIKDDIGLDSLELAELSAILEEQFESDPYSAGQLPHTIGDIVGFYGDKTQLAG